MEIGLQTLEKRNKEEYHIYLLEMDENTDCISIFFQHDSIKEPTGNKGSPTIELSENNSMDSLLDSSQNSSQSTEADELSLSQLTIEEQISIHIIPFYNVTPRCMPVSPHNIFEEEFSTNPWSLLVVTIFLTKTSGKVARPYIKSFFEEYPTPYHVLDDNPTSLERFFEQLGLKKRGLLIWKLSYQFVSSKWRRASDLCGIGKYGEDAYRIFCLGHTDLDPGDRYLRLYLDWLRGHTGFLEENGVTDCEYVIEDPVLQYYRLTLRDKD